MGKAHPTRNLLSTNSDKLSMGALHGRYLTCNLKTSRLDINSRTHIMGFFRFRRSIGIFPGVRWNIGKKSTSVSFGPRGLKYTIGTRGSRTTVGIPGTGLSYTQVHSPKPESTTPQPPLPPASASIQNPAKRGRSKVFFA